MYSYYFLTEGEVITGKSPEDCGLDVLTERYIKAIIGLRFPHNDRTDEVYTVSYLLYSLFSTILKKITVKTPEVIFHICFCVLRLSSSIDILKKYLYASFSFSY